MSLFKTLLAPVRAIANLSASAVALALGIPLHIAAEAIRAGCATNAEVARWVRDNT